ncbi:capsule polysaccharide transporter [Paracoccus denitrificans]|jgi:capsular polysaccharide transport system permease protein|uniref:Capsule polysaccharide export protein-like protein n=1 Tax=Paracoccus denitrificans (strain Pd 1222) TaxID=318586 RepID=A1B1E5_PARDP|nr:capsule polysaccharide transporter [Paracoccus denitrificans]ABL69339.1 capsule polysaccharide export protein-like protein [Paracoccus denitrificans PD1222]MBB4629198.1 capsular polysaccharide transport system permease protein [Paracoccus denitrificans]MCU7430155.1 capsule biosynthesis protein [Paracoccus denitrificans]QAR27337.1 capsule biosynthesis protein [Paracoccus denitrificans]UPV96312.1 capsule biosynthesis protein [Paracoccus denitrificans]
MTTPPKARAYRISREESVLAASEGPHAAGTAQKVQVEVQKRIESARAGQNPEQLFSTEEDGFGDMRFPGAAKKPAEAAQGKPPMAERIAAVRAENLTDRQLRMARRIAAMHEIKAASDHEAVVLLRDRGIDPFHRAAVGKILAEEGARAQAAASANGANMPVPTRRDGPPPRSRGTEIMPLSPGTTSLPSREALTEDRRAAEIIRIQQDIARRRRRRLLMLLARLAAFVVLPTLIAGWYYSSVATPLYATVSQFQIQQAEQSSPGGLGGLFGGTQLATNTDSVSVQSYLTSRDAMLRLDKDLGFKRAFQEPAMDPILRLPPDATNEQAYKLYRNSVKIGYDPTEGVINMEVIAPDPELSQEFSLALIKYAEGQVDQMTARLREDQMKGAVESYQDAERKVLLAQRRVQELQQKLGVLDPAAEGSVIMGHIAELERQLAEKKLELGQLKSNLRPNASRVAGVEGDIGRLEEMLAQTRSQLTEGNNARGSLATISGEIRIAESDLMTRQELLATAAAQMETARIEANKQVRYLSLSVAPVPPDEATYPKAFQNTIVAFLVFSGIYLMLSLTASILREQVSS